MKCAEAVSAHVTLDVDESFLVIHAGEGEHTVTTVMCVDLARLVLPQLVATLAEYDGVFTAPDTPAELFEEDR
jgi:hypothetical protein